MSAADLEILRMFSLKTNRFLSRFALPLLPAVLLLSGGGCDQTDSNKDTSSTEAVCPENTIANGDDCLMECPGLWTRGLDNRCRPPCLEGYDLVDGKCVRPCPEGTVPDKNICIPEDSHATECPSDVYNTTGAADEVIYVSQEGGTADGDGSRAAPYAELSQAVEAIQSMTASEVSIVVGQGQYDVSELRVELPDGIEQFSILGKCSKETELIIDPEQHGLYIDAPMAEVVFQRLDFQSGTRQIVINDLLSLTIDHCTFEDWSYTSISWMAASSVVESVTLTNNTFSCSVEEGNSAVSLSGIDSVTIESNQFEVSNAAGLGIFLEDPLVVSLASNSVKGSGYTGATIMLDRDAAKLDLQNNYFDGDWLDAAMRILGHWERRSFVMMEGNSLENHTPPSDSRSATLALLALTEVSIRDLRVEEGNVDGIYYSGIETMTISESVFRDLELSGLKVETGGDPSIISGKVTVRDSHFEGMAEWAIYQEDSRFTLELVDNVIEDNRRGVYSAGAGISASGNAVAANEEVGLKAVNAQSLTLTNNTVASNGFVGIDLSGLAGDTDGAHLIEANQVIDCGGVGISLRATGERTVRLSNNIVSGTRGSIGTSDAGESGEVGDGVSIVSYPGGFTSHVQMEDNIVSNNARLGVIVQGSESILEASMTDFENGNGYKGLVSADMAPIPNLLFQDDGQVNGDDADQSQEVSGLFITAGIQED